MAVGAGERDPLTDLIEAPASGEAPLSVTAELLAEAAALAPADQVLIIGSDDGALPAVIALQVPAGMVTVLEPNWLAQTRTRALLAAHGITHVQVAADPAAPPLPPGTCDVVLLSVPPERRLTRRWLLVARAALRPGGRLILAGANDQGIRSAFADAASIFMVTPLTLRRRHRVAVAVAPAPDALAPAPGWAGEPGIIPGTWDAFTVTARGRTLALRSLPGVFAQGRLDAGTALLLEVLDVPPGARVLDVGCGAGVIGLVAAQLGAGQVDLVDVNLLAVVAARENIARSGLGSLRALPSDLLSGVAGETYDLIVSNPPFHTGKAVDDRFAREFPALAAAALAPDGQVVVVTNRFIRYDQALTAAVGPVTVLAETGQFRVLRAVRR